MKCKLIVLTLCLGLSACKTNLPLLSTSESSQPFSEIAPHSANDAVPVISQTPFTVMEPCLSEQTAVDPQAFEDVWDRIKYQLEFSIPDNRRIRAQKNWYSSHPDYMQRVTERSSPYLLFIVEELESQGLPLELALLPIVESAFDPFAYSHGRASGMWQFIPGTGKNFGLEQNWWYDGRRDVYLSTKAALKYLTYLYQRFDGDWLHALAAYNSGEGNVSRAIRNNKKKGKNTDFWSLDLPNETRAYVPKLLALAEMLKEKSDEDMVWTPVDNLPYFDRVATESQIDLSLAAALADITMDEFYELNPGYNQWATAPKGPHHILLPVSKVANFQTNLQEIPREQRISFKKYEIQKGDNLINIAKKFGTTVQLLKDNNAIRNNAIREGKTLLIPVASETRDSYHKSAQQRLLATQNRQRSGQKINYQVKSGDSMWEISRKFKVDLRSLARWNNMAPTDPLKIGQKLVVWSEQAEQLASLAKAPEKTRKIYYKVRSGDSLAYIADKFNVTLNNVKKWNRDTGNKKYIQPGDSLTLYVDITRQF